MFLNLMNAVFNLGPKLPVEKSSYQIVTNPMGDGVFMLGGFEDGTYSKEIWQLKCHNQVCSSKPDFFWTRTPYELPTERSGFTAFYVPEKSMSCSY